MRYLIPLLFLIMLVFVIQPAPWCRSEENPDVTAGRRLGRQKNELQGLQRKLSTEKEQLEKTQVQEKKVVSELNRIEKELVQKELSLRTYEAQTEKKQAQIDQLEMRIENLLTTLNEEEAALSRAVRSLYQLSRTTMTRVFLAGPHFSDTVRQHVYLSRVIEYNAGQVDRYARTLEEIERNQESLQEDTSKLTALVDEVRSTQEEILRHKQGKTMLLAKVQSEKEAHLSAIQELEKASRQLQMLIDRLEKSTATAAPSGIKGFAAGKRKFKFPVNGDIITYFGKQEDREFSTISFNNGIEIQAAMGSPIKAIHAGAVIYASWFKGYGNLLILDHGEGYYTLSGHASSLARKVGELVKTGDTVGYVGDTGSRKGANLYFEIRHQGKPLNPLEWLRQH